jgi:hypothetical protein
MKSMQSMPMPAGPGSEIIARTESGLWDRLSGLLALIRPLFFILTPVNAAGAAVLALGGFPSPGKCVLGFIAVAFASCAVNVFNDYTDRERDKVLWPARPIPAGRISPREALVVVIVSLGISLSIAWLAFNPLTFSILLLAIVLGVLYSVYLRDKVGYLSLPPIVGLIYLGGWRRIRSSAAGCPGTFTCSAWSGRRPISWSTIPSMSPPPPAKHVSRPRKPFSSGLQPGLPSISAWSLPA